MERAGVSPQLSRAAGELMGSLAAKPPAAQTVQHSYSFDAFDWTEADKPYLTAVGNFLQQRGASQQEVDALLLFYKSQPAVASQDVASRREVETMDLGHAKEVGATMRAEWRGDFDANIRLINRHLDNLPAKDREAIEGKVLDGGRRALNDPATLRELAVQAKGGAVPSDPAALAAEIKQIEGVMAKDRKAYNRDEKMQLRYRQLLGARD